MDKVFLNSCYPQSIAGSTDPGAQSSGGDLLANPQGYGLRGSHPVKHLFETDCNPFQRFHRVFIIFMLSLCASPYSTGVSCWGALHITSPFKVLTREGRALLARVGDTRETTFLENATSVILWSQGYGNGEYNDG